MPREREPIRRRLRARKRRVARNFGGERADCSPAKRAPDACAALSGMARQFLPAAPISTKGQGPRWHLPAEAMHGDDSNDRERRGEAVDPPTEEGGMEVTPPAEQRWIADLVREHYAPALRYAARLLRDS